MKNQEYSVPPKLGTRPQAFCQHFHVADDTEQTAGRCQVASYLFNNDNDDDRVPFICTSFSVFRETFLQVRVLGVLLFQYLYSILRIVEQPDLRYKLSWAHT